MELDEFILSYCYQITKVLYNSKLVDALSDEDRNLCCLINQHKDIDGISFSEKIRTDMEVAIYSECNKFVEGKFREKIAFDIGNGIDCINGYFDLLKVYYHKKYGENIPFTLVNIKDLVVIRLRTIDLSSSSDQAMLLYGNSLQEVVVQNKKELEALVAISKKEVYSELNQTKNNFYSSLRDVEKEKTDIYKDIITIISIFAGIILTFSGAFSFSSAVLENVAEINFFKLTIAASLIAVFMLSLIVGLYFFIYNIRYDYPLGDNKLGIIGNKSIIKQFKRRVKSHRRSVLVPVIIAYIILAGVIAMVFLRHPEELLNDYKADNNIAITEPKEDEKAEEEETEIKSQDEEDEKTKKR